MPGYIRARDAIGKKGKMGSGRLKRTDSLGHQLDGTGNERVGEPVWPMPRNAQIYASRMCNRICGANGRSSVLAFCLFFIDSSFLSAHRRRTGEFRVDGIISISGAHRGPEG